MKRYWKRILWGTLALVAIAATVVAFLPASVPVESARISYTPLEVTLDAEGRTRIQEVYHVSAPITGELERVDLDEGDPVARGEVVSMIYPPDLDPTQAAEIDKRIDVAEANHRRAEVLVTQAELALRQAERDRNRHEELISTGAISQQQFDRVESAMQLARQDVASARQQQRGARSEIDALRARRSAGPSRGAGVAVRAPADGHVLRVLQKSRRTVVAGTPIVQIGSSAKLEVVVDVLSVDAVKVHVGDSVRFDGWGGERALHGSVREIEPAAFTKISALGIEEQRVNIVCDIVDPPPSLGDGYRLDAHIVLWRSPRVATIPTSALFRSDTGWSTFVVVEGKAKLVPIRLGHRGALSSEVTGGVGAGDRIILYPSDQIVNGVNVEVIEVATQPTGK